MTTSRDSGLEIWFLTGSQSLYGEETLRQVEQQSREIVAALDDSDEVSLPIVWKPVLITADGIRQACIDASSSPNCVGVIAWMHTFSPAKMWIGGLDALRKPLLHLHTQANRTLPWAEIDMDFMNLNQAAHGDREFGYLETRMRMRRKTVVGHVSDPVVRARVGSWVRAAVGVRAARDLRLARFGDNMRDVAVTEGDKTEAQIVFGMSVNTYGVNDLVAVVDEVADSDVDALVAEYDDLYDVVDELKLDGERRESLRYGARIELALRQFLEAGGFNAFTSNFEDLGGLRQLPGLAVQRLMADGYGFGGEGDWKTSALVRIFKAMAATRPAGPPSWRTTPTTSGRGSRACSERTCSRSVRASPTDGLRWRSTPWGSVAARTRCVWSSVLSRRTASWSGCSISATASGSSPTTSR